MKKYNISFFFPCYNEEDNVSELITQSERVLKEYANAWEIIIVNDGSSDRTREIVEGIMKDNSNLRLINHDVNQGYGAALTSGCENAKYDLVFFSDGDLQFNLNEISPFLEKIDEYDYIIGYRIKRQDNFIRIFNANLWNFVLRITCGLKVRDIDCAFKLFHRNIFKGIQIHSRGAFASAEILLKLKDNRFNFTEIGVNHFPRIKGEQTGGNPFVIFKAINELLKYKFGKKKVSSEK